MTVTFNSKSDCIFVGCQVGLYNTLPTTLSNPYLHTLHLARCQIQDIAVDSFKDAFPNLENLNLTETPVMDSVSNSIIHLLELRYLVC